MGKFTFKLPDVGEGVAQAEIVAWHVKPGDHVAEDQPLVDVMTDKATVEITSPVDGVVLSTEGEPGATAAIGSVLAVLEIDGAGEATPATPPPSAAPPPPPQAREEQPEPLLPRATGEGDHEVVEGAKPPPPPKPPTPKPPAPKVTGAKPLASPAVRQRAQDLGVRLEYIPGSGPAGRITREDLEAYAANPQGASNGHGFAPRAGVEQVKVIGLRRRIAEKMAEAKRRIPHFAYVEEVDVTELERTRAQLNAAHPDRPRLTILPFIARALTRTLPAFPQINALYDDEAGVVHRYAGVHLGIAAQTPTGLMVPVVRHAEALDLWAFAAEVARLAEAARTGKAGREELSGSTITLTSLGPLGGVVTTPVINHPEVAIIGPNRIVERPVVLNGQVVIRKMMNLSSSFDHRVVDGYDAAEFIQAIKRLLETPALLFVEQP